MLKGGPLGLFKIKRVSERARTRAEASERERVSESERDLRGCRVSAIKSCLQQQRASHVSARCSLHMNQGGQLCTEILKGPNPRVSTDCFSGNSGQIHSSGLSVHMTMSRMPGPARGWRGG